MIRNGQYVLVSQLTGIHFRRYTEKGQISVKTGDVSADTVEAHVVSIDMG